MVARDGHFYVVFDSSSEIASVDGRLERQAGRNGFVSRGSRRGVGYEDIAHDPSRNRFFALIEAMPRHRGGFMAQVDEYDEGLRQVGSAWLDFPLEQANKGLEGLSCVLRGGETHLLGLCEGNKCRGGAPGREGGGGRIQVFAEGGRRWEHVATVRLPTALRFKDYSSLALAGDLVAVLSQASSALWVGELSPSSWELVSGGSTYRFPRDRDNRAVYCNVEGVSWIAPDRVVVVSDKAKSSAQRKGCRIKDQSIHVFGIPAAAGGGDGALP